MHVLITGGLGYIGGRLATGLPPLLGEATVRLACRSRSAVPTWAQGFERVIVNLATGSGVAEALAGIDVVVHAAGASEAECQNDPVAARAVNVGGMEHLARAIRHSAVHRLIHLSTFHVYGRPLTEIIDETVPPQPRHEYGHLHLATESVAASAASDRCDVVIMRLSNAFGAPMDAAMNRWNLVFNDLCRQAAETGRMRLLSAGEQLRDFIVIPAVAAAIAHAIKLPRSDSPVRLFNLGSGETISIFEFASDIRAALGRLGHDVPIDRPPPGPGDVAQTRGRFDVGRLAATGFSPSANEFDREVARAFDLCRAQP